MINNLKFYDWINFTYTFKLCWNNFCEYRNVGHDNYKSLLLSYSDASEEFGPLEVKKVIEKSDNFKVAAIAIAAIKCPQHIME